MKSKWIPTAGFYVVHELLPEKNMAVLQDPKSGKTLPSRMNGQVDESWENEIIIILMSYYGFLPFCVADFFSKVSHIHSTTYFCLAVSLGPSWNNLMIRSTRLFYEWRHHSITKFWTVIRLKPTSITIAPIVINCQKTGKPIARNNISPNEQSNFIRTCRTQRSATKF